jgi:hypothetical protein
MAAKLFESRRVAKEYVALVWGYIPKKPPVEYWHPKHFDLRAYESGRKRKFTKGWDGQEVLNRPMMGGRKDYTLRMKHAASFFTAHQSQLKSKMASGASLEEDESTLLAHKWKTLKTTFPRLAEPFHKLEELACLPPEVSATYLDNFETQNYTPFFQEVMKAWLPAELSANYIEVWAEVQSRGWRV